MATPSLEEVQDYLAEEEKLENQSGSSAPSQEDVAQEVALIEQEDITSTDLEEDVEPIMSDEEQAVKNLIGGFYDYAKLTGYQNESLDKMQSEVEASAEYSTSMGQEILNDLPTYMSDVAAFYASRGVLNKTKYGAKIVTEVTKLVQSKNLKTSTAALAILAEAEYGLSSIIHEDEYVPGMGAAFGAGIRVAPAAIKDASNKTILATKSLFKKINNKLDIIKEEEATAANLAKVTGSAAEKQEGEVLARIEGSDFQAVKEDLSLIPDEINEIDGKQFMTKEGQDNAGDVKIYTLEKHEEELVGMSGNDILIPTKDDLDLFGLEGNYIFSTKSGINQENIRHILEEEIGHIIDRTRGLTEKTGQQRVIDSAKSIVEIIEKSGAKDILTGAQLTGKQLIKYFNPSELTQNPSRLQSMLKDKDGINKVLNDDMFKQYQELAKPYVKPLKENPSEKEVSEFIEENFEALKRESKISDKTEVKYTEEELDEFLATQKTDDFEEIATHKADPAKQSDPDIKQMEADRKFFSQGIEKIKSHYDSLNTEGKVEFVDRFKKLAGLIPERKPKERIYDNINELENNIVSRNENIKKLESQLKEIVSKKDAGSKANIIKQKEIKADISRHKMNMAKEQKELRTLRSDLESASKDELNFITEAFRNKKVFDFYRQEISDSLTDKIKERTRSHRNKKNVKPRGKETKPKEEPAKKDFTAKESKDNINLDKEQLSLVERLQKIVDPDTKIIWDDKLDAKVGGSYNYETNVIKLNPNLDDKKISKSFIHEMIHAATYHNLRKDSKLYKELEEIVELSKKVTGSNKYWSKNPDEMIAEFFAQKEVMDGLKDVEINRDIFYRLANLVRKIAGLKELPTTVGKKLNSILDDIESGKIPKASRTGKEELDIAVSRAIDKGMIKINRTLRDNGILKIKNDGTVTIGSFETDSFKTILNDLGVSNKATIAAIKSIRSKTLGAKKEVAQISKSIAEAINKAPESAKKIQSIITGRVASVLDKHNLDKIKAMTILGVASKHNIDKSELTKIIRDFGQAGVGKEFNFANADKLADYFVKRGIRIDKKSFADDIEILVAKREFDFNGKLPSKELIDTLLDIEKLEDVVLGSKKMHGYMGFTGQHDFEIKVATSNLEIKALKEDKGWKQVIEKLKEDKGWKQVTKALKEDKGWKQVEDTNTFYRLNIEADVSDGILPSSKKEFQGTIISSNIQENMDRMRKEGIDFTPVREGNKIVQLRVFPSKKTKDVLAYSEDPAKLMARKYRLLSENAIRDSIANNLDVSIRSLFSKEPKAGYIAVPKEMDSAYKKMMGIDPNEKVYVKKDMADLLIGVKETTLFDPKNRLGRMAEKTYKDIFKRFKRAVTAKSPSSIVNNYVVSFSMLKMAGVPLRDIPSLIRKAHADHEEFVKGMEQYYKIKIKSGEKTADKFMQGLIKRNLIAEMMADGNIQSGVDDAIIQMNNEADMLQYMSDSVLGFKETKIDRIINNIELKPNSEIGKFFLNKFVMADIVGRASMYNFLKNTKGLSSKEAGKQTTGLFVDFSSPLPKSIRILEEYGIPFIGWMYKVQLPLYQLMKKNPTSTAEVIAGYYLLQAMFDDDKDKMSDGYAGDLKIDSWFYHTTFMDTGVFEMSPAAKLELPSVVPQAHKELSGVIFDQKSPLELFGLNTKNY